MYYTAYVIQSISYPSYLFFVLMEVPREDDDDNGGGWTTVGKRRKPRKTWMGADICRALEQELDIWSLANCLLSDESKELQQQGYVFVCTTRSVNEYRDPVVLLPVGNKWEDYACFVPRDECAEQYYNFHIPHQEKNEDDV